MNFDKLVELLMEAEPVPPAGGAAKESETPKTPATSTTKPVSTETEKTIDNTNTGEDAPTKEEQQEIQTFWTQNKGALSPIWNAKYQNANSVLPEDISTLYASVYGSVLRSVKDSSRFPEMIHLYPLLDLLGMWSKISKQTGHKQTNQQLQAGLDTTYPGFATFLERLKKAPDGVPLDYDAFVPEIKFIRQDYFRRLTKEDIGKMALEKPEMASKSFMGALYALLAARKRIRSKKVDLSKVPSSVPQVEDIIYNPEKYAGGTHQIPRQLTSLYDVPSYESLITLGKLAKEYFDDEVKRIGIKLQDEKQAFKAFLNNQFITEMEVPDIAEEQQTAEESLSFLQMFKGGLLNEAGRESVEGRMKGGNRTFGKRYGDLKYTPSVNQSNTSSEQKTKKIKVFDWNKFENLSTQTDTNDETNTPEQIVTSGLSFEDTYNSIILEARLKGQKAREATRQEIATKQAKRQEQAQTAQEPETEPEAPSKNIEEIKHSPEGGYTIANIKMQGYDQNIGSAKAVYDKLKQFADFISKQPQTDLVGGLNQITGAFKTMSSLGS